MIRPSIGLDEQKRKQSVDELNKTLANESVLINKTKKFHWDISGPQFKSLHELWDTHYETLSLRIDEMAERIRMLGGYPIGTMQGFLEVATLKEQPGRVATATESVKALLADHEHIIRETRDRIELTDKLGDAGTADFLTATIQEHEKMAWMLRSFVEGEALETDGKNPAAANKTAYV